MAVTEVNPEQMAREMKAQEEAKKEAEAKAAQEKNKSKKPGFWQKAGDFGKKALKSPTFWAAVGKLGKLVIKAINHPKWWGGNDQKVTGAGGMYATTSSSTTFNMVNTIACVKLDFRKVINLDFVESDIERLITALNTKVGFDTGLTSSKFKNYIEACALAYIVLTMYLRDYNGAEYKTVGTHTVGDMIDGSKYTSTNRATISIGRNMYHTMGGQQTVRTQVRRPSLDSISNHDYEQIIAKLDNIKLSDNMKEFIEYLFGAFFSNGIQSGVNSLIIFDQVTDIPSATYDGSVPAEKKYSELLNTAITNLQAAVAACPYVEQLADALGFTTIEMRSAVANDRFIIATSYQRNVTQNVINVADDDSIIIALENMTSCNYDSDSDTFYILTHSEDLTYSTEKDKWSQKTVGEIGSWLKLVYMEADWYALSCYGINNTYSGTLMESRYIGKPVAIQTAVINGTATARDLKTAMDNFVDVTGYISYHQVIGIADTDGYRFKIKYVNDVGGSTVFVTVVEEVNRFNAAGADVFKHTQYTLIKAINMTAITMGMDYRQPMVDFINTVSREANKMLSR